MLKIYFQLSGFIALFIIFFCYLYLNFRKTKQGCLQKLEILRQELATEIAIKNNQQKTTAFIDGLHGKTQLQFTKLKLQIAIINFTLHEIFN